MNVMLLLNCQYCNKEFVAKRKDAKWCSSICGNRRRNRKHYYQNKERIQANRLRTRITHRIENMLARCKHRAKQNNIPFNLTKEDISIPIYCPVLNIKLKQFDIDDAPKRGYNPDSPFLDRIIPSLGYVKGNVRVISARANLLKNDATISELELVLADLKRVHGL